MNPRYKYRIDEVVTAGFTSFDVFVLRPVPYLGILTHQAWFRDSGYVTRETAETRVRHLASKNKEPLVTGSWDYDDTGNQILGGW